jgi:hypothetical protein
VLQKLKEAMKRSGGYENDNQKRLKDPKRGIMKKEKNNERR